MIRVAFIKFGGLSAGGTEKFLQTIAANLSPKKFMVDYYYCNAAPYKGSDYKHLDTDLERMKYMQDAGVNLVEFHVGLKDVTVPTHDWMETDFWDLFKEDNYDAVFTGRAGHPEYPFYLIKNTPIIDTLHLRAGADNQKNIKKVIHLSEWNAKKWIKMGGDRRRVEVLYQPVQIGSFDKTDLKKDLGLDGKFIFGFHQRNDDSIFSPIPLLAYSKLENETNHCVVLNGSIKYKEQAKLLGLKNITFLPFAKTQADIYNFLKILDVFTHGRKDGEINSTAIAEAMAFGLPIVSHFSKYNNGHCETIGEAGVVLKNTKEYVNEMRKLQEDKKYYEFKSCAAVQRFEDKYSFNRQIEKIQNLVVSVVEKKIEYSVLDRYLLVRLFYKFRYNLKCWLVKIAKQLIKLVGLKLN